MTAATKSDRKTPNQLTGETRSKSLERRPWWADAIAAWTGSERSAEAAAAEALMASMTEGCTVLQSPAESRPG
jgi:hypothetical protein